MSQAPFIFFAVLATVLIVLPLPLHWRARNVGTLLFIGWVLIHLFINLVNTSAWIGTVTNKAPIWCDISIKLSIGVPPGLTGASLCINRRLATIATNRQADIGAHYSRNALLLELAIGIGAPCILMALSYVAQAHRANIGENIGCLAAFWPCIAQVMLGPIWPVIFSVISSIYGFIAIKSFVVRRLQFTTLLQSSSSGLTTSRYLRLAALASCDLFIYLPLSIYQIITTVQILQPWTSWTTVHSNFGYVIPLDASYWEDNPGKAVANFLFRWIGVLFAVIFFIFFGVSEDALAEYARWGRTFRSFGPGQPSTDVLPMKALPHLGSTVERRGGNLSEDKRRDSRGEDRVKDSWSRTDSKTNAGVIVSVNRQTV